MSHEKIQEKTQTPGESIEELVAALRSVLSKGIIEGWYGRDAREKGNRVLKKYSKK